MQGVGVLLSLWRSRSRRSCALWQRRILALACFLAYLLAGDRMSSLVSCEIDIGIDKETMSHRTLISDRPSKGGHAPVVRWYKSFVMNNFHGELDGNPRQCLSKFEFRKASSVSATQVPPKYVRTNSSIAVITRLEAFAP